MWLKRTTTEPANQRLFGRLILTTSSLVIPIIALAATGPANTTDGLVRSVSALVLAGAVTLRVTQSVRANGRTQADLRLSAQTDALTHLPNRLLLLERINDCLRMAWQSDSHPTLYFVDLDRFKNINDSLGHAAGDEVLKMVAMRLSKAAPEHSTVARLSGDEYVVLDPSTRSPGASLALAERLLSIFREPLPISQGDVFVTASIGVASLSPSSSSSAEDLLRHADTAMYRAKDAGRNCLAVYDESMHERVAHRLSVETALYRALDRRELRLFHQPILDLESGDVVGFEALMRWQQGDGTIVSPAEFIPIAEDTGTIVPIGSWALLEALSQLRSWIDDGVCSESATMSVNVSPRQLSDPNFPSIVNEALTRSGVSPQLLWLEVTESVMIAEPELALATLATSPLAGRSHRPRRFRHGLLVAVAAAEVPAATHQDRPGVRARRRRQPQRPLAGAHDRGDGPIARPRHGRRRRRERAPAAGPQRSRLHEGAGIPHQPSRAGRCDAQHRRRARAPRPVPRPSTGAVELLDAPAVAARASIARRRFSRLFVRLCTRLHTTASNGG